MNRSSFRWLLFKRFLAISCLILFIPFTIASLIVLSLIPVYLSNHAVSVSRTTISPPFNASYLLMDEATKGSVNINTIDRNKLARSFERELKLKVKNILQVNHIYSNRANQNRRKRTTQCNRDSSKPLLTFDFNLTYPINSICQTQKCIDITFAQVYQQFQNVPSLTVDMNNLERELQLCSFDITSSLNDGTNSDTSDVNSTSISTISNGNNSFSLTKSSSNIQTTSSMENSNKTDIITFENCLAKQPFIQESVPPYRINHTNTLIYRHNRSLLLLVGASKIEIFIQNNRIQQETYIDDVLVYKDCQRTYSFDLPFVYYSSLPL